MEDNPQEMEENKETKGPHLRLVAGFKDGDGETPITNWLLRLPVGTQFFAHDKNPQTPLAEEYVILTKTKTAVCLHYDDHRGQGNIWVNAELFIKFKIFDETIGKVDIASN